MTTVVSANGLAVGGTRQDQVILYLGIEQWNPPAPALDVTFDNVTFDFQ